MANAASLELNEAWSLSGVKDVSVAIPTQFSDSGFHPYGDGQSNSKISFNSAWNQPRPQIVATLIQFSSAQPKVRFRVDRTIQRNSGSPQPQKLEIYYLKRGTAVRLQIDLKADPAGDYIAEWDSLPSELDWTNPFHNVAILVRPQPAYTDWFPIFFRHPVQTADALIQASPPGKRKFTGNMAQLSLINPATGKY